MSSSSLQASTNAEGVPLFACTKCNSRHPFEDLSQGHQLCKECRNAFQVIKCNYCRTEFHQETNSSSNGSKSKSICVKCKQLEGQHGKPGPCAYCNIIAAFIGTKCQRCTNSEKKYGQPMACEHCKQKCAFDRHDPASKKKVDGKLLCWLCTMAYKRTLAKARQKEAARMSSSSLSSHHKTSGVETKSLSHPSSRHHNHHSSSSSNRQSTSSANANSSSYSHSRNSTSSTHQDNGSTSASKHRESSSSLSSHKKPRIDSVSTGGGHQSSSSASATASASASSTNPLMSSLMDGRFIDPNSSNDLSAVVTQLKDQVATLNKRLQLKEKELLLKDQQIAELRAASTRDQRENKEKINTLQKQHTERMSEMQARMISLQKQLVAQTRAPKPNPNSYVEPPLVI